MKSRLGLALSLLLAALPLAAQNHDTFNGQDVAANQVILRLNSSTAAVLQQITQLGNADSMRALNAPLGLYLLHSQGGSVAALLAILKTHPSVAYVEPDYYVKLVNTPNDTYFSQQWDMLNTATPGADIGATRAWNITTGNTNSVAGVVDTGIDYTHPDLAPNVWSAPSSFTVTLSWGRLTCPAGSHGYNAIAHSCDPMDDNAHGTHVSGTIGAAGNNNNGVAGVNWTTRIMGLKFMNSSGSGLTSDAIDAMEFAIQAKSTFGAGANVRVLSNSWGGSGYSQALLDEINKAGTNEMLFVVAAGNSSQSDDLTPTYPASFSSPTLIAVAATTNTDTLASFSNWGVTTVALGAPGVNILSTLPNNTYGYYSGTSMATPHVAGAAMLILSACSLNTAALKSVILANVDPIPALSGITQTGGRLDVAKALQSCTGGTSTPSGTASFLKTDTTTLGSWKSAYGADGANVIGDSFAYPSYATIAPSGNSTFVWTTSTTDARALQDLTASGRVAACWYGANTFQIDVKFNDSNTHQVALYLLDWDGAGGGRSERIDILDSNTNAVFDSRAISAFTGGKYLVWNLSGHVVIRMTNTNSSANAIINGLFFGGPASINQPPTGTAAFLTTDTTTSGSWKSSYGADGANVIDDTANYPAYVAVTPAANSNYIWTSSTTDTRALQKVTAGDRIAACWYTFSNFTIDLAFNDSNTHRVALYLLDWDGYAGGRSERIDILDANNNVLDTRNASGFSNGQYLVWNLSGHVIVRVTNTNGSSNAVLSGLFFGGGTTQTAGTASFVKTDTTTKGTWKTVYGLDGANIIGDVATSPAYATASPAGTSTYVWTNTSSDTRALQEQVQSNRIAACWYASSSFTIDLSFSDANIHPVELYFLDWDSYGGGRAERIDILDVNNNVLDTRSLSGFSGGQYLMWNLSGHVIVRVTNTNAASNAVVNGVFYR